MKILPLRAHHLMWLTIPRPEFYIPFSKELFIRKGYPEPWTESWLELYEEKLKGGMIKQPVVVFGQPLYI